MAIEKLSVVLELVTGNYKREAQQAATATGGISKAAGGVSSALKSMIGPAAIGGAVVGLVNMAQKAGENADRLFDLQAQTGATTDQLQEFEFVAAAAGAKQEFFADSIKQVIKNMDQALAGTGAVSDAYTKLGVSVTDANGQIRAGADITAEVIEKLAGMENITERNALAQDLFGKKWEETVSVLDMGSEAIADLREEGKKAVISPEALRNADKFREAFAKLQAILGPKLNEALGKIAPLLTEIAEGAVDALDAMEPLIDALGFVAEKFGEANDAIEEGRDSPNQWAQRWAIASDIGKGYIFGVVGALGALFDEENVVRDNTADLAADTEEAGRRMQFMADATKDDLIPALSDAVRPIDSLRTAQQRAADATKAHADQIVILSTRLAAQINPALGAIQAVKDLKDANDKAREAAEEFGEGSDEAAEANVRLALQSAITSGVLVAFGGDAEGAIRGIAEALDISTDAAREMLEQLGLFPKDIGITVRLDWEIEALDAGVIPEGLGLSNPSSVTSSGTIVPRFHSGGIVPGPRGSDQLILAQGGERVLPINWGGSNSWSRSNNFYFGGMVQEPKPLDLQYLALLSNHQTFGKF